MRISFACLLLLTHLNCLLIGEVMKTRILSALLLALAGQSVLAVEEAPSALQEITNFRQYSEVFAAPDNPPKPSCRRLQTRGLSGLSILRLPIIRMRCRTKTRS